MKNVKNLKPKISKSNDDDSLLEPKDGSADADSGESPASQIMKAVAKSSSKSAMEESQGVPGAQMSKKLGEKVADSKKKKK